MIRNPHARRLKVLLIAPYFDRNLPGESWSTYRWVRGICERCETTVLTTHRKGWKAEDSPIAPVELVNWTHTVLKGAFSRFERELMPNYILFYLRARRWIRRRLEAGERFDVVHQINPLALRYPSPAAGQGLKYVLGPHAGSLETPPGFRNACRDKQWYRKLRGIDGWRMRNDPLLRRSISGAALVLGVAPYVGDFLSPAKPARFEVIPETGPELISEAGRTYEENRPLRLLFVGRIIHTKGILYAIRAIALARAVTEVTLDVIGEGDLMDSCRRETGVLGLDTAVTFHGRQPREAVYEWYRRSDVFLFPSFREPSGNVVFEAMGFGLPVITSTAGGPGHIIDETCGIRVEPRAPEQYARDLSKAILALHDDRMLLSAMSSSALNRMREVASWETRLDRLESAYHSL